MSAAEPGSSTHTIETIDVIIGMDATGSMSSWIEAARDTVLKAFDDLRETYPNAHFRLGLVCYRDFGDAEQFVTCALTENIQDVQNSLRNVKASGGNDTSEDVAGGLARIVDMFRAPPQAGGDVRILLFVADAPAHGLRYHAATVSDRYPRGDPEDREPADQMSELARMGVDTTLFRIDKAMDKMIEGFNGVHDRCRRGSRRRNVYPPRCGLSIGDIAIRARARARARTLLIVLGRLIGISISVVIFSVGLHRFGYLRWSLRR